MPRVTKEQVAAARRMTAIEFLRRYRADDLVKSSARGEYELRSHDSFKINGESSLWHWKSRGIGGKSALDYLMHVEGCSFVEAVRLLCDEQPVFTPQKHADVERQRPPFKLPEKCPTTTRVEAYLRCRGISQPVIDHCLQAGILYESLPYHNCVFVGRDADGEPKYAALRGTYTCGKQFKAESTGSDKRFGFCIEPSTESGTVAVFEAAIDAMAEMTLAGDATDKYRLSLGGIYAPEDGKPIHPARRAGRISAPPPAGGPPRVLPGQRPARPHRGSCTGATLRRKISCGGAPAAHRGFRLWRFGASSVGIPHKE